MKPHEIAEDIERMPEVENKQIKEVPIQKYQTKKLDPITNKNDFNAELGKLDAIKRPNLGGGNIAYKVKDKVYKEDLQY